MSHTLAQNCHCEFCCGVHLTTIQLHLTGTGGCLVWSEKMLFFGRHLEEGNKINRSQEELRNISRKLEWTRDSPQSQIVPTVQKDTWEVTFIRSCAKFKNPDVILVEKRHGGSWVGHTHHDSKIAGTFAQQLGWVVVGPCHPSAHGPPAKLRSFTSLQMVLTHTHIGLVSRVGAGSKLATSNRG